jgi:hypothetical protein
MRYKILSKSGLKSGEIPTSTVSLPDVFRLKRYTKNVRFARKKDDRSCFAGGISP